MSTILPQLIARHLLADDERQMLIMSGSTNGQKAQYLLDIMPRKEKGWFELFIECLCESSDGTGHHNLIKELETKFWELREQSVTENKKRDEKLSKVKQSSAESQRPVGEGQADARADAREEVSKMKKCYHFICYGHDHTS